MSALQTILGNEDVELNLKTQSYGVMMLHVHARFDRFMSAWASGDVTFKSSSKVKGLLSTQGVSRDAPLGNILITCLNRWQHGRSSVSAVISEYDVGTGCCYEYTLSFQNGEFMLVC